MSSRLFIFLILIPKLRGGVFLPYADMNLPFISYDGLIFAPKFTHVFVIFIKLPHFPILEFLLARTKTFENKLNLYFHQTKDKGRQSWAINATSNKATKQTEFFLLVPRLLYLGSFQHLGEHLGQGQTIM